MTYELFRVSLIQLLNMQFNRVLFVPNCIHRFRTLFLLFSICSRYLQNVRISPSCSASKIGRVWFSSIHACMYVCIILYTHTCIHTYIQIHTTYMIHDNTVNSVYIGIILSKWLGCKEYIYKVQAMQSSSDNAAFQ